MLLSPMEMSEERLRGFTLKEVAQSRPTTSSPHLLVIHNKVYDVTSFISEVCKNYLHYKPYELACCII